MNWTTEDIVKWLHDIDFSEIAPNVINAALDGQKILTIEEERICSGLDLGRSTKPI